MVVSRDAAKDMYADIVSLYTRVSRVGLTHLWTLTGVFAMSSIGPRAGISTQRDVDVVEAPPASLPPVKPGSLSVVLPAYNEEAVIEKTIAKVLMALSAWLEDFELVVVNDGSRDRTAELVERLARQEPRVRLVNHEVNQGYGAALATGFRSAHKELVFFMDADGQFDIRDLAKFFPLLEQYDAVLGYRNPRRDPWPRKFNAWGWKQLVRLCFGIKVRDIDCAFKLYRAEFFQTFELETRGAMINTEMLYKFTRAGYSYAEVGVRHLPREEGTATGAKPAVILRALRELVFFARKWSREERATRNIGRR